MRDNRGSPVADAQVVLKPKSGEALLAPPPPIVSAIDATEVSPSWNKCSPARNGEVLYLHSVPTSSDDWAALLELSGGLAPDLPGFGRTSKAGNLDYSLPA